ncbi:uncharacterized protein LOC116413828 [Galleria mellonella]|uniref:Uncharacterized protein LOC116413828 n=1 Tax=Galleria mellonella TaxID=7137 RepID=A0A6J3CHU4_GALME|nr:uncharacterized protein LOC116413828 [Galleria mellonella]
MLQYILLFKFVYFVASSDVRLKIADDVVSCDDFDNDELEVDLKLAQSKGCGPKLMGLSGVMRVMEELEDEHTVELSVYKDTEVGKEMLFTTKTNLCASIKDDNAPWFPVVEKMAITSCPIEIKDYPMQNILLDLNDCVNDMLTEENCGVYAIEIAVTAKGQKISCHMLAVEMYEYEGEDDSEEDSGDDCEE